MSKKRIFFLLFSLSIGFQAIGQKNYILEMNGIEQLPSVIKKYSHKLDDSIQAKQELEQFLIELRTEGYITVIVDSLHITNTKLIAYLIPGNRFLWENLSITGDIPIGYRMPAASQKGRPLNDKVLKKWTSKLLKDYENIGFPFAKLDQQLQLNENSTVSVQIHIDRGPYIRIDTVRMIPEGVVKSGFINPYLGIKRGTEYTETVLSQVDRRISSLEFVKLARSSQVLFAGNKAKVNLFLGKQKANVFDGLIGLQPKNNEPGKIDVTGDAQLRLLNSFRHGEEFNFRFRGLPNATRQLQIRLSYPYVFSLPVGLDVQLDLFKQDSQYVDISNEIGLQYLFIGANYIKVFARQRQSTILATSNLENATVLPDYADVSSLLYGLAYRYITTNSVVNPIKGLNSYTEIGVGTKQISPNAQLDPRLYEGVMLQSQQYRFYSRSLKYFYVAKLRSVVLCRAEMALLYTDRFFNNDLFKIGGNASLRGFDEQSIAASKYGIAAIEYRFLLEEGSFLFGFYNQAYYQNSAAQNRISDDPFGFGAGLSIRTKAGFFSLSYGIGKQFKNPIDLQGGKVHFGIINNF